MRDPARLKRLLIEKLDEDQEKITQEFYKISQLPDEIYFEDLVDSEVDVCLSRNVITPDQPHNCTENIGPYCGEFKLNSDYDRHVRHWHRLDFSRLKSARIF